MTSNLLDVQAIRSHFDFLGRGRLVTNNAASTQPRRELLPLYRSLGPRYENVHRGQSTASREMTALFEDAVRHDRGVHRHTWRAGARTSYQPSK